MTGPTRCLDAVSVQHVALLQGRSQCPMQAVLEVQLAAPLHDVGEQVAVERRVLVEQSGQIERPLRRDQLVEPDLAGWQSGPVAHGRLMVRVGPAVADALEDHAAIIGTRSAVPALV